MNIEKNTYIQNVNKNSNDYLKYGKVYAPCYGFTGQNLFPPDLNVIGYFVILNGTEKIRVAMWKNKEIAIVNESVMWY